MQYNGLVTTLLSPLECESMVDGTSSMRFAPEVTCKSAEHIVMLVESVIGIFVYIIGIPLACFLVLQKGRQQDTLKDEVWLERLGFLYTRYEHQFCTNNLLD